MLLLEQIRLYTGHNTHLRILLVVFQKYIAHHPILMELLVRQFADLWQQQRLHDFLQWNVRTICLSYAIPEGVDQANPNAQLAEVQGHRKGNGGQHLIAIVLL